MEQAAEVQAENFVKAASQTDEETRYRGQVARVFNRISPTGLPEREPQLNELPLDKVFVTLSIAVQQATTTAAASFPERLDPLAGAAASSEDRRRTDLERRLRPPPEPLKLSVGEALHRFRRLVIIGAPGSGKTTLVRWLAVIFAAGSQADHDKLGPNFSEPRLPIVLDLRRFADRLNRLAEQPAAFDLAEEAIGYISQDARFAQTPRHLIQSALSAGRCLLLLDGLDEIADQATRRRLIEAVEALFFNPSPGLGGNICLLTTRPHGFANLSLGAGFETATIRPFGREDVASFITNWYRIAYGEDSLTGEAAELIIAMKNNDRVESLASNPLLCTIIVVVYRNNRVLPDRRTELYLKCCEVLLDRWERNKDIKAGLIGGLNWQGKLELLASLAYWMHGETERLAASEDQIVEQIAAAIVNDKLADLGSAAGEARGFIELIRNRSGILQGRGDGSLEFSHRTFQEYLAARHIAAMDTAMDDEAMLDAVMPHLHNAWWKEVHLLLFGHLGSSKEGSRRVGRLAFCVLDAAKSPLWFLRPPRHPIFCYASLGYWFPRWQLQARIAWLLRRDLALAALGFGQCTATAQPNDLTDRLVREISDFVSYWRGRPQLMGTGLFNLVGSVFQGAKAGPLGAILRSQLLAALKDSDSNVRWAASGALGSAASDDPAVAAALLAALKDSDVNVRGAAARALGSAASGDPAVVAALLAALTDSEWDVRMGAAQALGSVASGDPAVASALLAALKDGKWDVRVAAARALGWAALGDPAVVAALLAALKDSEWDVRWMAARALGSAASGDPAVVAALLAALKDSDVNVRWAAARALGSAASGDPAVVAALLAALKDSRPSVRAEAAQALGSAASGDPAVVAALLAALKDNDDNVRSTAARALGWAALGDPAVESALLAALKDSDVNVRTTAAQALGSAVLGDPAVVAALLAALKDSDVNVRTTAAQALGSAASGDPAVVASLLRAAVVDPSLLEVAGQAIDGRQLPGYRWYSLAERRRRRERWSKLGIGAAVGLTIGLALYFGGEWFAGLPDADPTKNFLKAVPAISTLLGLVWGLFLVFRGEKRTIWG